MNRLPATFRVTFSIDGDGLGAMLAASSLRFPRWSCRSPAQSPRPDWSDLGCEQTQHLGGKVSQGAVRMHWVAESLLCFDTM